MSEQIAVEALRALIIEWPEPAGWKVAFNVKAVQEKLGVTRALAAPLPTLRTYAPGATMDVAVERRIHVEAELVLRMGADVRRAGDPLVADGVAPCLELVDYALPRTDLATMFTHSFFHAGVVLGAWRPLAQLPELQPGYPRTGSHHRQPDQVPDDILDALAGAAERIFDAGGTLRRGQLILCGSFIEPAPLVPGQAITVDYGPALGTLSIARSAPS